MKKKNLEILKGFLLDIVVLIGPIIVCGVIGKLVGDFLNLPYELKGFVFVFSALVFGASLTEIIANKIFK